MSLKKELQMLCFTSDRTGIAPGIQFDGQQAIHVVNRRVQPFESATVLK
jgi:hypothetical protein